MGDIEQDDKEQLELHSDTLAALQEFYSERLSKEKRFQDLKGDIEQRGFEAQLTMDMFTEDWNASQFWYSKETAIILAEQLLRESTAATNICVVSAPSVFVQLKNFVASGQRQASNLCLLEFDHRFDVFREFIHYDFQRPLALPGDMKGKYDCILCDPPFLSSDCQTKVAMTVRWLLKPTVTGKPSPKIVICTGERMEELVLRLYPGIATTTYDPQHAQNRLSNAFRCYSNYEGEAWSLRQEA